MPVASARIAHIAQVSDETRDCKKAKPNHVIRGSSHDPYPGIDTSQTDENSSASQTADDKPSNLAEWSRCNDISGPNDKSTAALSRTETRHEYAPTPVECHNVNPSNLGSGSRTRYIMDIGPE